MQVLLKRLAVAATLSAVLCPVAVPAQMNGPVIRQLSSKALSIQIHDDRVTVGGVTPRGEVTLFWHSKRSTDRRTHLSTDAVALTDADGDGVVSFEVDVPLRSVWAAVDMANGAFGTAAPSDFPLVVHELSPSALRPDKSGELATIEIPSTRLAVLVARRGGGAWLAGGRDGIELDRDEGSNGKVTLSFEDARFIGDRKQKGPKFLNGAFVLVAIDTGRLEIFIGAVQK